MHTVQLIVWLPRKSRLLHYSYVAMGLLQRVAMLRSSGDLDASDPRMRQWRVIIAS